MTTANEPASSATRQNGGGQPTSHGHDPCDEQPRRYDRAEEGEQVLVSEQRLLATAAPRPRHGRAPAAHRPC
jgi:hypothetical protein